MILMSQHSFVEIEGDLFSVKISLSIRDGNNGRRIIKKNEVFFEHYIKMKI